VILLPNFSVIASKAILFGVLCFTLTVLSATFPIAAELPDFHSTTQGKVGYPDNETTSQEPLSAFFAKFHDVPSGYGQVPFYWFPGDKLTKERLTWQLGFLIGQTLPGVKPDEMPKDYPMPRIGGIQINCAHARGSLDGKPFAAFGSTYPLDPPLFSPEFWELWAWLAEKAGERNLGLGISDYVIGWPGQGHYLDEVIADPVRLGKSLKMQKNGCPEEAVRRTCPIVLQPLNGPYQVRQKRSIVTSFYWESQPKSIDFMDEQVGIQIADRFFGEAERQVPEQFRKSLNYFFSDEFCIGNNIRGLIWTPDFAEEFQKRKGYDIKPQLLHLFETLDDTTPKIRLDYHDVRMALRVYLEAHVLKINHFWHQAR